MMRRHDREWGPFGPDGASEGDPVAAFRGHAGEGADNAVPLHGLVRERVELTGEIRSHEEELRRLAGQFPHLGSAKPRRRRRGSDDGPPMTCRPLRHARVRTAIHL